MMRSERLARSGDLRPLSKYIACLTAAFSKCILPFTVVPFTCTCVVQIFCWKRQGGNSIQGMSSQNEFYVLIALCLGLFIVHCSCKQLTCTIMLVQLVLVTPPVAADLHKTSICISQNTKYKIHQQNENTQSHKTKCHCLTLLVGAVFHNSGIAALIRIQNTLIHQYKIQNTKNTITKCHCVTLPVGADLHNSGIAALVKTSFFAAFCSQCVADFINWNQLMCSQLSQ